MNSSDIEALMELVESLKHDLEQKNTGNIILRRFGFSGRNRTRADKDK